MSPNRSSGTPGGELPWCFAVARHHLANAARSARRRSNLIARIVRLDPPVAADIGTDLPDPEIHRALARLTTEQQELLRLSAWEGLSPAEIAVVLGVSANAVSIRLHRARRRLADILTDEAGKDGRDGGQKRNGRGGSSE